MKMYEVNVSPDDGTIHLQRSTAEQFRVLLAEHATGSVILQGPGGEDWFSGLGSRANGRCYLRRLWP